MRIDLHTHSTASDGTDTPSEVMAKAAAAGLDVIALTDHDTTGGWAPAAESLPPGLTLVRGTEFSCAWFGPDERRIGLHLLGYLYSPEDAELRAERARLRENRIGRGRAIVENMIADGIPITWDRVSELAAGGSVGRPHIGRALVEAGLVPDVDTAFTQLLSSRGRYYVRKQDLDVFTAIRLVAAAGGVTVFAHPLARRRGRVVPDDVIVAMATAGLDALEVDHPDHDPADRDHLRAMARDLGLAVTGSSDYHGTNKAIALGAETTRPDEYEALLARRNTPLAPIVLSS